MNELPLNQILCGDCVEVLKDFPEDSIDLVVTDPNYGLNFMGLDWDKALPPREAFEQIIRVLKPGALAFVMSSPRQDLMARMIILLEDAGFNTRLSYIDWIYKTGFPKVYDVSKGIDRRNERNQEDFQELAKFLRTRRIELGFNQKDISKHFPSRTGGLTGCVSNWELGYNVPTIKQWIILKKLLNIENPSFDEIINRIEAEREVIGIDKNWGERGVVPLTGYGEWDITQPALDTSKKWEGWKSQTGLKPAHEPILMVNKPFSERTIVDNVLKWGTGAINVDVCRIPLTDEKNYIKNRNPSLNDTYSLGFHKTQREGELDYSSKGRFPANLLVSDKALDTGKLSKSGTLEPHHNILGDGEGNKSGEIYGTFTRVPAENHTTYGDVGDQSRYFDLDAWARQHGLDFDYSVNYDKQLASLWYNFIEDHKGNIDDGYLFDCLKETLTILRPDLYDLSCLLYDVPKPDNKERDYGLKGRKAIPKSKFNLNDGSKDERFDGAISLPRRNTHPTVKPIKLMAYLIELGCPPDGVVLDPFVGSGTTCIAAKRLVRKYVGIEINPEYIALAEARIRAYPIPFDWFTEEDVGVPPNRRIEK